MTGSSTPASVTKTLSQTHVPSFSLFAQLLASERLTIQIASHLKTANFSPASRVLTLPSWQGFSEDAWLLFISHEVGHALFTPPDGLTTHPAWTRLLATYDPHVVRLVANVFEDIRIERLIRAKYRGLSGVFNRGYYTLLQQSFFGFAPATLTDTVWTSKTALDRINLYAKVGALLPHTLTETQEIAWYNRAVRLETYDEMLALVEDVIKALAEAAQKTPQQDQSSQDQPSGQSSQDQPSGQSSQDQPSGQSSQDQSGAGADASDANDEATNEPSDASSEPQDAAQHGSRPSQDQGADTSAAPVSTGAGEATATTNPFEVSSQVAAQRSLEDSIGSMGENKTLVLPVHTDYLHYNDVSLTEMLAAWTPNVAIKTLLDQYVQQARREQSQILASMIASFRANQSAWRARRQQVSRSGVLDTTKLSQYKLTDDLFLRRQSVPDAQNHGFVLHIDFSGSMEHRMSTVLWQVLHLIWFAESIKVPVAVYGFSTGGEETAALRKSRENTMQWASRARLIELYRSDATPVQRRDAQSLLFGIALQKSGLMEYVAYYPVLTEQDAASRAPRTLASFVLAMHGQMRSAGGPRMDHGEMSETFTHKYVGLMSTPLFHALFASVDHIRAFRSRHRIEQCISVWLTDGDDSDGLSMADHNGAIQRVIDCREAVLFDPRSGRTFQSSGRPLAMLFDLHRAQTGATVVCVDITELPLHSLRRVVTKNDLAVLAGQVGVEAPVLQQYGRRRRRRGIVTPKKIVQTRKRVILPVTTGTFTETGLLHTTRKDFPTLGCDAYIVSHPEWWTRSERGTKAAVKGVASAWASSLIEDDEDATAAETEVPRELPESVKQALLEQHAGVTMRRFTDLLVPFLAAGREDGTVR